MKESYFWRRLLTRSDLRIFLSDVVALWDESEFRWSSDSFGSKVSLATGSPCGTSSGLVVFPSPFFSGSFIWLLQRLSLPCGFAFFTDFGSVVVVFSGCDSCEFLPWEGSFFGRVSLDPQFFVHLFCVEELSLGLCLVWF